MAENATSRLPRAAVAYIATVVCAALALAALYGLNPDSGWPDPRVEPHELVVYALLLAVAAVLTELYPIPIPTTSLFDESVNQLVVSSAIYVASLLLFGPAFTIVVVALAVVLAEIHRRKPYYKVAFNTAQYVLTVGISGLFLLGVGNSPYSFQPLLNSPESVLAVVGTLVAYLLLNTGLVAAVVALAQRVRWLDVWEHVVGQVLPQYIGMLNAGLVAAILWTVSPLSLVLLVLPILVVYLALRTSYQLKSETVQALISLAGTVDSRDSYTYRHSMDVARYAAQVAARLGLPLEEAGMVKLAAQLHDIGKMGTPDQILHKPGALTTEEMQQIQEHPEAGAKVLQYFSLFRGGVDLVLHHHEHYDGSGYPRGLAGEQIPLGARILHVADAYQAMTSNRVYREAMSPAVAVGRLLASAGSQFDPRVVKAFVEVLQESEVPLDPASVPGATQTPAVMGVHRDVLRLGGADRRDPERGRA